MSGEVVGKVLVVVPTYNEAEALPPTLARLRAAVPAADVLVVDDASPDGTGELAEKMAVEDPAIHVLHRTAKNGLGGAYIAGFGWALEREYTHVVEMDADGSHRPEDLPQLLAAAERGADLVLGSRWVPGGSVVNWPMHRKLLSRGGNFYTQVVLGLPLRDGTGGFRVYRAQTLRRLGLDQVASQGYCFQVDMAWRVVRDGGRAVEVPITFVERELGESKMSGAIVAEALTRVTVWGAQRRLSQLRSLLTRR